MKPHLLSKYNFSRKTAVPSTPSTQTQTQHTRVPSAHVGGCSRGSVVPEEGDVSFFEAGAKLPESSSPGGKSAYRIPAAQLAKAKAAWAVKAAARQLATNCCRCGKPHDRQATGRKQCPACRAYAAKYRGARRARDTIFIDAVKWAALERRVANLEHYFANLSRLDRVAYKRGWCAGRRLHRKAAETESYRAALTARGAVGFEDLQQISHAYAR